MLAWMPAREFLKITFIMGIPFIFALGFMMRRRPYSFPWVLSALVMLVSVGGYIYFLTDLPERIETRRIITQGGTLVAEGKYDQAINEYRKLAPLGRTQKMHEKIAAAEKERKADQQLQKARKLLREGREQEAQAILKAIDATTRAGVEAKKLKAGLNRSNE